MIRRRGELAIPTLGRGILAPRAGPLRSYSTSFPLTEDPISEGGNWIQRGLDWTRVVTAGGLAYGTQSGLTGPPFDDSYAYLANWDPAATDQYAEATIHLDSSGLGSYNETEILLRVSDGAHVANMYEINIAFDGFYFGCGRWPGALGTDPSQYTVIFYRQADLPFAPEDGDKLWAQIVGYTVTGGITPCTSRVGGTYPANVPVTLGSGTDTDVAGRLSTGAPGIGYYAQNQAASNKFSFSDFSAIAL